MKTSFTIFIMCIFVMSSCSDNDEVLVTDPIPYTIKVESYIELSEEQLTIPDEGADIYIYYGVYSIDIVDYNIEENGILSNGDKKISPQLHENISDNGQRIITVADIDEKITILIRSKIVKDKIASASFTNSRKEIHFEHLFKMVDPQ